MVISGSGKVKSNWISATKATTIKISADSVTNGFNLICMGYKENIISIIPIWISSEIRIWEFLMSSNKRKFEI